jgi:integrase
MAKTNDLFPYVALRRQADGSIRPRFVPGSRERAMGFKGQDLKHDDGQWYTLDEAHVFALAKRDEIRAQRKTGKKLKSPPVPRGRAVKDLWLAYSASNEFKGNPAKGIKGLAPSSQETYRYWTKPLQEEPLWEAPVGALDPVVLKNLHDRLLTARGLSMARGSLMVLQAMLSWGRLRGWLPKVHGHTIENPANKLDLPPQPVRLRIGTDVEISALVLASDHAAISGITLSAVGDAILTGLFSGQRKRDVLAFVPGETSPDRIDLVQSKTGARVSIPMTPRLTQRLAQGRARRAKAGYPVLFGNVVVNEETGRPYVGSTFRDHFRVVRVLAVEGIVDEEATQLAREQHASEMRNTEPPTIWKLKPCPSLADFTFPDLRDTAVTWYARAGSTVPEIASITGHAMKSIYTILKHYLALDAHLADNAVKKLVEWMEREGLAV